MSLHFEILVEEPSMEAFLHGLLPRLFPSDWSFAIHPFQGKCDLFAKLEARLRGYAGWLPANYRIVVVVDRDDDDCLKLKQKMEDIAAQVGLRSRTRFPSGWQLVNRIVIEELEAWYFGAWDAVRCVFGRLPESLPAKYRDSDSIAGGTWEAFERIMKKYGYFKNGLRKIEVARAIGQQIDPFRCRSQSFQCFRDALLECVNPPGRKKDQP